MMDKNVIYAQRLIILMLIFWLIVQSLSPVQAIEVADENPCETIIGIEFTDVWYTLFDPEINEIERIIVYSLLNGLDLRRSYATIMWNEYTFEFWTTNFDIPLLILIDDEMQCAIFPTSMEGFGYFSGGQEST